MIATRSLLHPNEPLPPYTPRHISQTDLDASSVHSQAPSYVSEVPSYHSGPQNSQSGTATGNQPTAAPNLCTDNSTSVVAASSNRHLGTMANRPPSRHSSVSNALLPTSAAQSEVNATNTSPPHGQELRQQTPSASQHHTSPRPCRTTRVPSLIPPDHPAPRHEDLNTPPAATTSFLRPSSFQAPPRKPSLPPPSTPSTPPMSPLEDPLLVGSEAAAQARSRRLYIASCTAENRRAFSEAETELMRKQESKDWDFLLAQMGDWGGRERNWKGFRGDRNSGGVRR